MLDSKALQTSVPSPTHAQKGEEGGVILESTSAFLIHGIKLKCVIFIYKLSIFVILVIEDCSYWILKNLDSRKSKPMIQNPKGIFRSLIAALLFLVDDLDYKNGV